MNCSVPIDVVVKGWNVIEVVFDAPKIAVLVGTTAGFQLVAVLKAPEPGLSSQVAFCACADVAASNAAAAAALNKYVRIPLPPAAEFLNAALACFTHCNGKWQNKVLEANATTIGLRLWLYGNISRRDMALRVICCGAHDWDAIRAMRT